MNVHHPWNSLNSRILFFLIKFDNFSEFDNFSNSPFQVISAGRVYRLNVFSFEEGLDIKNFIIISPHLCI